MWRDEHAAQCVTEAAARHTLQGISSARLPTDVDRPRQQQEQQLEDQAFKVGVLKASVTSTDTTPALLLALYGTLLSRYVQLLWVWLNVHCLYLYTNRMDEVEKHGTFYVLQTARPTYLACIDMSNIRIHSPLFLPPPLTPFP